jgi:2-polyprenyl-3-methyl-5-hydroxy-6-metoxy-1,4-benzoquinol methylase
VNTRSEEKELMDQGLYTPQEYEECLQKLFLVGKYARIHRDTYKLLDTLQPKTILDVGCGDGAFLAAIAKRYPKTGCVGIDISEEAIGYAVRRSGENLHFRLQDKVEPAELIMVNLVCHHMTDSELEAFLLSACDRATKAVLINDLQRHKLAKILFRIISGPLFSNRLISHDGLVSIERGFWKSELETLIKKLPVSSYAIKWRFPFRWQVILWK